MTAEEETLFYDDDNVFRSHRWPDQHGGEPDASADKIDDTKEGMEPGTTVIKRKQHQQSIEKIHGPEGLRASLPIMMQILDTNIEMLKTLKVLQELMEYQIPLGRTYSFTINYPAGSTFTHIDFTDEKVQYTFGLPSGTTLNLPGRKAAKLKIFNDGPGVIKFSSNMPVTERLTEVQLNAGEFDDSLSFNYTIISTLNIAVSSGAPTVRVFCIL